jgi:phosphoribosylformylglycinamidine synthase subunit PurS
MKIRIYISLKKGVLDTQGKAIENLLVKNFDYNQISNVSQGKFIDINIDENGKDNIKETVDEICDKFLVNKVIEDYNFEIIS